MRKEKQHKKQAKKKNVNKCFITPFFLFYYSRQKQKYSTKEKRNISNNLVIKIYM